MKIKIMTTEAMAYVKENIEKFLPHYIKEEDPTVWIKKELGKDAFIEVQGLEFADFNLIVSEDGSAQAENDPENIKILYMNMIGLNDSFATDERLWAGLAHTTFYSYIQKRWKINKPDDVLNHYFFKQGRPRCYMTNTLARLWWIGRKCYLDKESDPYKIIDYIGHDLNGYLFTLFGSNWSNNRNTLLGFFEGIWKFEEENENKVGRELFNDVMQYVNGLSGIYIVDAMSKDSISNITQKYLVNRVQQLAMQSIYDKASDFISSGNDEIDKYARIFNNLPNGIGTIEELCSSYEIVYNTQLTLEQKKNLENKIKSFSNDVKANDIHAFYHVFDDNHWRISNQFLARARKNERNKFIKEQKTKQKGFDRRILNLIDTLNHEFDLADILAFEGTMRVIYPTIAGFKSMVDASLLKLRYDGLIETIGMNKYRKVGEVK